MLSDAATEAFHLFKDLYYCFQLMCIPDITGQVRSILWIGYCVCLLERERERYTIFLEISIVVWLTLLLHCIDELCCQISSLSGYLHISLVFNHFLFIVFHQSHFLQSICLEPASQLTVWLQSLNSENNVEFLSCKGPCIVMDLCRICSVRFLNFN